MITKFIYRI